MIVGERRSSWLLYLVSFRSGAAMVRIRWRLLFFVAFSVLVTAFLDRFPESGFHVNPTHLSIVGIAHSIFLGFRNNVAYDRFWEGRKLWGSLVNESRSLAREALTFLRGTADDALERQALAARIIRENITFVHALRIHLRDEEDWSALEVSEETRAALERERNKPTAIIAGIGALLREGWERGWLDSFHHVTLEQRLVNLTDVQGACERIKSTPIPLSYTALTHRITAIYLLALPFGLAEGIGPGAPLLVLIVAFAFLGLDSIGDELEDPFGLDPNDLALKAISTQIETNLLQRLGEEELPEVPTPDASGRLI